MTTRPRTICIVTGSRAEYGLLRGVMSDIRDHADLHLQVVATGMHLSPDFGLTFREIEGDGFVIDRRVEMLLSSDTAVGTAKAMGVGLIGLADVFADLQPDLVLLLGDRFEMLAAASAALVAGIPMAHVHGGELTEGAFDESIRHALTKMSAIHFVAADEYRRRVIQMGEDPERVFTVGGLGVDAVRRTTLMSRADLEVDIGFVFGERALLVTFHPATREKAAATQQMSELLTSLAALPHDVNLLFTLPNADPDGRALAAQVRDFVAARTGAVAVASLGMRRYVSCLALVDGVVGNSSSGLLEAPTFGTGTINIGDRQRGRLRASSIIDCEPTAAAITSALAQLWSPPYRNSLAGVVNPYGDGGASRRIVDTLALLPLHGLGRKVFRDLPEMREETGGV